MKPWIFGLIVVFCCHMVKANSTESLPLIKMPPKVVSPAEAAPQGQASMDKTIFKKATVASDVIFKRDIIFTNPVELITTDKPECRIFGLITEDGRSMKGIVKRLICKVGSTFTIWNVEGTLGSSDNINASIPFKSAQEDDTIVANTPVTINITQIGERREGYHIYLYDSELGFPMMKIQLDQLLSYQPRIDEQLPELEGQSGQAAESVKKQDEGLPELEPAP